MKRTNEQARSDDESAWRCGRRSSINGGVQTAMCNGPLMLGKRAKREGDKPRGPTTGTLAHPPSIVGTWADALQSISQPSSPFLHILRDPGQSRLLRRYEARRLWWSSLQVLFHSTRKGLGSVDNNNGEPRDSTTECIQLHGIHCECSGSTSKERDGGIFGYPGHLGILRNPRDATAST